MSPYKWNGTSPSFIAIAEVRIRQDVGWVSWVLSHCPVCHALVMLENKTRAEAAALSSSPNHLSKEDK